MKKILLSMVFILSVSANAFAITDKDVSESYRKSYNYEKANNYNDAIKSLSTVYNTYKDAYTINLRLGWLYYLHADYANSKFHYDKAMKVALQTSILTNVKHRVVKN